MRTKNFLKHLFMGSLLLTTGMAVGQVTTTGNVASGPTDFLGWNSNVVNNLPLMVRHDRNQPIDGHFGIGPFSGVVSNPYTMLHVDQAGANDQGYREEMREGMSSSRGDDYGYVGLNARYVFGQ